MTCGSCRYAEFLPREKNKLQSVKCLADVKTPCHHLLVCNECQNGKYEEQTDEQMLMRSLPDLRYGTPMTIYAAEKMREQYIKDNLERLIFLKKSGLDHFYDWQKLVDLNVTRTEWTCLFSYVANDMFACDISQYYRRYKEQKERD